MKLVPKLPKPDVATKFVPPLKRLANGDWFTTRVSATGLFAVAYPVRIAASWPAELILWLALARRLVRSFWLASASTASVFFSWCLIHCRRSCVLCSTICATTTRRWCARQPSRISESVGTQHTAQRTTAWELASSVPLIVPLVLFHCVFCVFCVLLEIRFFSSEVLFQD